MDEWLVALGAEKKETSSRELETPFESTGPQTILTKLKILQHRVHRFLGQLFDFQREVQCVGTMLEEEEERASEFYQSYAVVLQEISAFKLACLEYQADPEEQEAQQIPLVDVEQYEIAADTLKQTAADKWEMALRVFAIAQQKIRARTFQNLVAQLFELRTAKYETKIGHQFSLRRHVFETGSNDEYDDVFDSSQPLIQLNQLEASEISIDIDLDEFIQVPDHRIVKRSKKNTKMTLLIWGSVVVFIFGVALILLKTLAKILQ